MKPVYPAARELPSYENLLLEMVEPNILKVTLNRPKAYNALSHGLVSDLTELAKWLVDEYYNIRVVLLYGGDEGKGFCAGLDVKQGLTDYEETVPGFYHYQIKLGELEWFISKTPQPWITLIDNVSAGGGFSLAMCSSTLMRLGTWAWCPRSLRIVLLWFPLAWSWLASSLLRILWLSV